MGNNSLQNINVFDEMLRTVETIGVDKTVKALQKARSTELILEDLSVENILKLIAEITNVPVKRILNGTDRTDDRKMAVALAVFHIKEERNYSLNDLISIFGKERSGLSRYYNLVRNKPSKPKSEFDKKLNEYDKKIQVLLKEKKLTNYA